MRVKWHAYCCGGRVVPIVFRTRKAAVAWIERWACDGTARVVRVETP